MALLVPIVILPLVLLSYSISLFLSSLGVYIRDMGQVVSVIIALMLFMSPIFYPITAVPEQYRMLIYINPLTFIVEALRDVVLYGKLFSLEGYALYWGISIMLYVLAITWFKKVRGALLMSSNVVVSAQNLRKVYQIYSSPMQRLGLCWVIGG